MKEQPGPSEEFPDLTPPAKNSWKIMLPVWAALLSLVWVGLHFGMDEKLVAGVAILFGLLSSAFAWMLGVIGLVPVIGPIIVKILAIPVIWLLNGVGYLVSYIAIRRGHSQAVLNYRALTITLIIGVIIGYILGKLV